MSDTTDKTGEKIDAPETDETEKAPPLIGHREKTLVVVVPASALDQLISPWEYLRKLRRERGLDD